MNQLIAYTTELIHSTFEVNECIKSDFWAWGLCVAPKVCRYVGRWVGGWVGSWGAG